MPETTSPTQKPTVVLVHGAWHGAWCWAEQQAVLRARGINSIAVDLPGHGADTNPLADLTSDGAAVSRAIADIAGPVVLVGHSYGGSVITEAAADAATAQKVTHLVYLCAIARPQGETFLGMPEEVHAESKLSSLIRMGADGTSTIDTSDPAAVKGAFYGDCSDDQVTHAIANLCPQPMANLAFPATVTAPALIASTYVICTDDYAIPIAAQHIMINDMVAAGAPMHIEELAASHSPFLSMPDAVAEILVRCMS